MKHENSGDCPKCNEILDKYPGFHAGLRAWFKDLQKRHTETHTSCAGRGRKDQELCRKMGTSRARYGQSAHNWNCALDFFELQGDLKNIYEKGWFGSVIAPAVTQVPVAFGIELEWYGRPHAAFHELPHVELKGWKVLQGKGLKLVE